jgi:hypothetical protein
MSTSNKAYKYANANGNISVSVNPGSVLGSVVINKLGAASNTLTIYDDVSAVAANVIAVIDTTRTGIGGGLDYNVVMSRGIFMVMATGTAADITITYQ